MVEIIDNPVMMTREEIKSAYEGRWVYVVNCEYSPGHLMKRGMPVIVADMQYEDVDTGIYDKYDAEEYGEKLSLSLFDISFCIPSVSIG